MQNLQNALLDEQDRCREILLNAKSIGPAGNFLVWRLTESLRNAEKAIAFQDVERMIAAYNDLKTYSE